MTSRYIAFAALLLAACAASAQPYPSKPVRIFVGFTAGSSIDVVARILAQKLNESWKQPVIIDNRPGAGGNVAADAVAKAAPDGYTLLAANAGIAISAAFYTKLPYDVLKDLRPITQFVAQPHILTVHPTLPAKSIKELIALAKAKPGEMTFASGGVGNSDHLAGELFKWMAGANMVHVPYKGGNVALNGVITGEVTMYFPGVPVALPMIKAGRVKALAVTSSRRLSIMPNVPTISEAGVKGYEVILWYGFFAPAALPREIAVKVASDLAQVLKLSDVQEKFAALGVDPVFTTSEEFGAFVKSEIAKWTKVRKATGLTIE